MRPSSFSYLLAVVLLGIAAMLTAAGWRPWAFLAYFLALCWLGIAALIWNDDEE